MLRDTKEQGVVIEFALQIGAHKGILKLVDVEDSGVLRESGVSRIDTHTAIKRTEQDSTTIGIHVGYNGQQE